MAIIRPDKRRIKARNSVGRFTSNADHVGTIMVKGQSFSKLVGTARAGRRRSRRQTDQISFDIVAKSTWVYNVRADVILEHVSLALLRHHHAAIIQGVKADGSGAQKQLAAVTLYTNVRGAESGKRVGRLRLDQRNRKSMHRGFKTGFFADTIHMSRITGSTRTARVKIEPDPKRNVFLAMEWKRGIQYLFVRRDAAQVIEIAMIQAFDAALEGDVRFSTEYGSGVNAARVG